MKVAGKETKTKTIFEYKLVLDMVVDSYARSIRQIRTHKSLESRPMSSHLIHATSWIDIYQLKKTANINSFKHLYISMKTLPRDHMSDLKP